MQGYARTTEAVGFVELFQMQSTMRFGRNPHEYEEALQLAKFWCQRMTTLHALWVDSGCSFDFSMVWIPLPQMIWSWWKHFLLLIQIHLFMLEAWRSGRSCLPSRTRSLQHLRARGGGGRDSFCFVAAGRPTSTQSACAFGAEAG